jgi:hypothetical protein
MVNLRDNWLREVAHCRRNLALSQMETSSST